MGLKEGVGAEVGFFPCSRQLFGLSHACLQGLFSSLSVLTVLSEALDTLLTVAINASHLTPLIPFKGLFSFISPLTSLIPLRAVVRHGIRLLTVQLPLFAT